MASTVFVFPPPKGTVISASTVYEAIRWITFHGSLDSSEIRKEYLEMKSSITSLLTI